MAESESRMRAVRMHRGLTVAELAGKAGVSTGLISQVERGLVDPSLETLRKVARVLEIPLFSLLQDDDNQDVAVIRRDDRITLSLPHSDIVYSRLSRGGGRLEVLEGLLKPGCSSAPEPRGHPSEECLTVLEGQLVVEFVKDRRELEPGDSSHFDSRLPHRFVNESDAVARFLVCITPPSY